MKKNEMLLFGDDLFSSCYGSHKGRLLKLVVFIVPLREVSWGSSMLVFLVIRLRRKVRATCLFLEIGLVIKDRFDRLIFEILKCE